MCLLFRVFPILLIIIMSVGVSFISCFPHSACCCCCLLLPPPPPPLLLSLLTSELYLTWRNPKLTLLWLTMFSTWTSLTYFYRPRAPSAPTVRYDPNHIRKKAPLILKRTNGSTCYVFVITIRQRKLTDGPKTDENSLMAQRQTKTHWWPKDRRKLTDDPKTDENFHWWPKDRRRSKKQNMIHGQQLVTWDAYWRLLAFQ